MKTENAFTALFTIVFILAFIFGGFMIKESIECGQKGGVYITNASAWPFCAQIGVIK